MWLGVLGASADPLVAGMACDLRRSHLAFAIVVLGALLPLSGCSREGKHEAAPSAVVSPSAGAPSAEAPAGSVEEAVKQLSDPRQAVRDAAAATLRKLLAEDPTAARDPGEAHWKKKLAGIPKGISSDEFARLTGASSEGGASSGQSSTTTWRLDDYWTVTVFFDLPDRLREVGELRRSARRVWVEPGKRYSGGWTTYYVNGVVDHRIEYVDGEYRRFASYYDNGQLINEQHYKNGAIDGPELGFHRGGERAYAIQYAAGNPVGRWTHWYANGNLESEQNYADGKLDGVTMNWRQDGTKSSRIDYRHGEETGQAAWDEHGALLYARGTASDAK